MKKNVVFYFFSFLLLVISYLFLSNAYKKLTRYVDQTNRSNAAYVYYKDLFREVNNAAVLNPELIRNGRSIDGLPLFFTDSLLVIQQLANLKSSPGDSVNNQVIQELELKIEQELSWILNSNVPDSLINHNAMGHIAALQQIDSLIKIGTQHMQVLLETDKEKLSSAMTMMRLQMLVFILLAAFFLVYTSINFARLNTKTEKRFRALVEHGEDVILLTNREGKVLYLSPGIEKLTGFTVEELMGRNIAMIMHPDNVEVAKEVFRRLLKNPGLSIPGSNRLINKNGGYIDVEGTVSNLLEDKNVRAVITNFRDITERKREQEKLASSESRFRSLIENSNDIILMLDANNKVIYRGPSAQRVTGFTDQDMLGKNGLEFIHPDDRTMAKNVFAEIHAKPGVAVKFSCRNLHKKGHYIWIAGTATNFLPDTNINALVFNFRDITEQKQAKEKLVQSEQIYRTIASSIPGTIICILDAQLRYNLIEGNLLESLGYSKEMLLGKTPADILKPDEFSVVGPLLEKTQRGETVTRETNINGFDIISRYIPLKDETDAVYATMTVSTDITEIKNAQREILAFNDTLEQRIIERTSQLEAVNNELQQFAYIASHDLQQPLRTVSNYMQIFEEDYIDQLDSNARKYLQSVNKATSRMSSLINSLLDFSKLTHHKQTTTVNVGQVIEEMLQDLNKVILENDVIVEVGNMPYLDLYEIECRQLFQNLVLNGIKFQPEGNQPVIKIWSEKMTGKWKFSVSDNGIGIEPQFFKKIFKIFQRLGNNDRYQGSGIGLANCKKIVQLHHGEIWVESTVGKGSTFHFTIPDKRV